MHVNILDVTASTSANVPRQDPPQKANFGTPRAGPQIWASEF